MDSGRNKDNRDKRYLKKNQELVEIIPKKIKVTLTGKIITPTGKITTPISKEHINCIPIKKEEKK